MEKADPEVFEPTDSESGVVSRVRAFVAEQMRSLGQTAILDDTVLVASELATNALLHAGGIDSVRVLPAADGVRVEVRDGTRVSPLLALVSTDAMTGRGLRMVASLASRWSVQPDGDGKVVWAELSSTPKTDVDHHVDLLDFWSGDEWDDVDLGPPRYPVTLGEVPTELLISAKAHVDNLVREFMLAAGGAMSGVSSAVPPHLASLIDVVVSRFAEARQSIKRQSVAAAMNGQSHVRLSLNLPATAADAGEDYLRALDEVDAYCRAARLLTLETPPQHRVFRQWYVGELVSQLRAAAADATPPPPESFEQRLLREIDAVAEAHRASDRAARLFEVSAALAVAGTPEAVAAAVLERGVVALGAFGGGLLLATAEGRLSVPGTVGYGPDLVAGLRSELPDAELPAAVAARTGESVWIESRTERDTRFPELKNLERGTIALCAVPLVVAGQALGALRFSFSESKLFDEDERRFVLALAAQAAQALDRAQLNNDRVDLSLRLQRSLLPGRLPDVPGLDIAAVYHPLGDGMELGGDFYDVWPLAGGSYAFAIGDAAGTGPEAAAITAMVRYSLRALTIAEHDPTSVLADLNTVLVQAEASGADGERFCTVLFGVVTSDGSAKVTLAGGGHPYPMVRRADGEVVEIPVGGTIVGVLDEAVVETHELVLAPGDCLIAYTDGVIEARVDGDQFGTERLRATITASPDAGAAEMAHAVEQAVLRFSGREMEDDLAVLVVKVRR